MNKKHILLNAATFSLTSLLVTVAFHFLNVWLLSNSKDISPIEALFVEGLIFLFLGLLLLFGSGGINLWSIKAIMLSALAGAIYDEDTVGPSELLRRDRWKPQGFVRIALVLIMSGIFMIITYFVNAA